ncbi:hypothetical protein D6851_05945 [Altericroceibacterium spongiae]|uniref:Uncharacterized protein n=1 Tax=Altericroceibacterium spongiae TaxID=2320269 RepID=A0A420EPZ1_9SPHN|nr:hypothetical protein [Altericroceibacterium spongiae]RKF22737.1 hypothetical protein D6851_05945 [Altericroceibacterium spongiae]
MHDVAQRSEKQPESAKSKRDWRRRMSDNVAYALLAYTGLQIFVTMHAVKNGHGSILPYFALIVLIAAIIPACRAFERRWDNLTDAEARDPSFEPLFRRDRLALWLCAIGLPFALTLLFKGISALFSLS